MPANFLLLSEQHRMLHSLVLMGTAGTGPPAPGSRTLCPAALALLPAPCAGTASASPPPLLRRRKSRDHVSEIIRSEITHAELITQHRSGSKLGSLGAEQGGEPGHQGGQGRGLLVPLCCRAGAQSIFSIPGGFGEAARCCVSAVLVLRFGEAEWHRAAVLGEKPCPGCSASSPHSCD